MKKIIDIILDEPVMGAAIGLVIAGYAVLEAFGVSLTAEQQAALGGFGLAAIAVAVAVRKAVEPKRKLARQAASCSDCDGVGCDSCTDE